MDAQVQSATILASVIDMFIPLHQMTQLWQMAAEEESRENLFGHLSSYFI